MPIKQNKKIDFHPWKKWIFYSSIRFPMLSQASFKSPTQIGLLIVTRHFVFARAPLPRQNPFHILFIRYISSVRIHRIFQDWQSCTRGPILDVTTPQTSRTLIDERVLIHIFGWCRLTGRPSIIPTHYFSRPGIQFGHVISWFILVAKDGLIPNNVKISENIFHFFLIKLFFFKLEHCNPRKRIEP